MALRINPTDFKYLYFPSPSRLNKKRYFEKTYKSDIDTSNQSLL
jgi:hypothetical protein